MPRTDRGPNAHLRPDALEGVARVLGEFFSIAPISRQ